MNQFSFANSKVVDYLRYQMQYDDKYTVEDFAKECKVTKDDVLNLVFKKYDLVSYAAVLKMMEVADNSGLIFFD